MHPSAGVSITMLTRKIKKACGKTVGFAKSGNPDSNRGPLRPERSALPAALLPEIRSANLNELCYAKLTDYESCRISRTETADGIKKAHSEEWALDGSYGARTRDLRRDRPAR